jgi:hypothetical protein
MQSFNDLEFWMDPAGDPTGMNILNKNENAACGVDGDLL